MTKTYYPLPVLPEYTDEALRDPDSPYRCIADLLLTVPAEYRQAAEAENAKRTGVTHWHRTESGLRMAEMESIGDPSAARREIVAEIRAQLGL